MNVRCIICETKHCSILCPESPNVDKRIISQAPQAEKNVSLSNHSQTEVILQTLLVSIEAVSKRTVLSQRSYILESTIKHIGITSQQRKYLMHIVFTGISTRKKHKCYKL